jgi:hypothetical protein
MKQAYWLILKLTRNQTRWLILNLYQIKNSSDVSTMSVAYFMYHTYVCGINPTPDGYNKVRSRAAGSHMWLPRWPIGERKGWLGRSHQFRPLHLERARDRKGSSEIAWCADYLRGECLGRGWKRHQNWAVSCTCWPKITKNTIFYSKVLNKIHFQDVFWGLHEY